MYQLLNIQYRDFIFLYLNGELVWKIIRIVQDVLLSMWGFNGNRNLCISLNVYCYLYVIGVIVYFICYFVILVNFYYDYYYDYDCIYVYMVIIS
jgi:hypothetical protein